MCEIKRACATKNIMALSAYSFSGELQVVLRNSEPGNHTIQVSSFRAFLSHRVSLIIPDPPLDGRFAMRGGRAQTVPKGTIPHVENTHSQSTHMDESKCARASPVAGILKISVRRMWWHL